jgi:hypothetical protein
VITGRIARSLAADDGEVSRRSAKAWGRVLDIIEGYAGNKGCAQ